MPTNTLTDHRCKSAKPTARPYKLFDGHGLYLYVTPTGSKLWRMAYRVDGKARTASFGPYPLLTLKDARERRDVARLALLNGTPIKPDRKKVGITLRAASDAYWPTRQDISADYIHNATRALERHIFPRLGTRPIADITRADVLDVLGAMDAAALHVYVRKTRLWLSHVFDWAVHAGHCTSNPCAQIDPKKAFTRARVESLAALEINQIPAFMDRLKLEGIIAAAQACRLLALTGLRTKELRMMRWTEIDGDLLRVPRDRMKKGLDLLVPLSSHALAILDNMRRRSTGSEYVFPNARRADRPMSENAVLYLIARMGYAGQMTGHGWRSVLSTWANERGYNPDAIERQLAHVPGDKVRGIYNRAEHLPERRAMLQDWGDWLMGSAG